LVVREAGSTPRYRYHQLLRTFLEAELRRRDLRLWQHLHGVAARWYLDVGRPERALGHAVMCEDRELVEALLGRQGLAALLDGEPDRLAEVLHRLPSRWRRDALPPALRAALALEENDAPSAALRRTQPVRAVLTPLTPAERDLLQELPSLRTVPEIAGARHVSVNTVKSQLSSVYRKLDVHGRRAAVEVARAHGLL